MNVLSLKEMRSTAIIRLLLYVAIVLPSLAVGAQITQIFDLDLEYMHTGSESHRASSTESASYMLFDASLGLLESVEFTSLGSSGSHSIYVRNLSAQQNRIYINPEMTLNWTQGPNRNESLLSGFNNSGASSYPAPGSEDWDLFSRASSRGGGGYTRRYVGDEANSYVGTGMYDVTPRWVANIYANAELGTEYMLNMSYHTSYEITYNYTAALAPISVPEPSAWLLFASAITGLILFRPKSSREKIVG